MPLRTVFGRTIVASYAVAEIIDRLRNENERLEEIEKRYRRLLEIANQKDKFDEEIAGEIYKAMEEWGEYKE